MGYTRAAGALALGIFLAAGLAQAQSWTASGDDPEDLRYRLDLLSAELSDIRARLGGDAGGDAGGAAVGGDALVRLDRLEAELRRLTGAVERLEFQQRQIAEDATRRFGDVEFRLTELEGGDLGALTAPAPVGGIGAPEPAAAPAPAPAPASDPAVPDPAVPDPTVPAPADLALAPGGTTEPAAAPEPTPAPASDSTDLELAIRDVQQGRFDQGEDRLHQVVARNPGPGELARANYWLGQSRFVRGAFQEAARYFLASYNVDRTGPVAPESLLQLGVTLGRLGQTREACLTLREVRNQFPTGHSDVLTAADVEADNLACGG